MLKMWFTNDIVEFVVSLSFIESERLGYKSHSPPPKNYKE